MVSEKRPDRNSLTPVLVDSVSGIYRSGFGLRPNRRGRRPGYIGARQRRR
jgi:hypothetical protein